ncbi:hypothetical protein RclHR1_04260002 [Rhizophagus clarus]|uniref:BTB domain-containing protein n=1 Tax=Rhizophagus clarus TaxID=94130 RepID=A0A2Z6RYP2_9GLOM|nr:hypothetical protein RclHR1_04260002 [Rhizophagus clarus]GES87632.1 hypothetical protein GLOIN_2v1470542 [Rhizophagus clarus]
MTPIFYSNLSKDLSSILNDSDDYNVIIQVGENQNTKEFRAHSVILRARSSYFRGALSSNWITKQNNMIMFNKPNVTPIVFDMILKYIYTGELDLTNQTSEDILRLLIASDELLLEELLVYVQDYLIEEQINWIRQNFVLVLHTVFRLVSCKKLQDYCLESICENPLPFITSRTFLSLDKDILFNLLERDDILIEEIAVWDCLIKWGIEQTPGLGNSNSDKTNWSNENYEALKKTLNQFIPLIRFMGISHTDLFNKVYPYKSIIPDRIFKEIDEFYYKSILPSLPLRTRQIESNIIKLELVNLIIVNWIDKKNSKSPRTGNDPLYKFKLIYRGTRDGINSKSFKNKCNGRVPSLVLIKIRGSNKIFGGYSSIGFNSLGELYNNNLLYYYSSNNFIFSFDNNKDMKNMKLGRVINDSRAIMDYNHHGFNFGWAMCMVNQNLCLNDYGNYEKILSTEKIFNIEEIETFLITNNNLSSFSLD